MEFLLSYGWAILVIMVVLSGLAYFGLLDVDNFMPDRCHLGSGISCVDHSIETNRVRVILKSGVLGDLTITEFAVEGCNCSDAGTLVDGVPMEFIVSDCNNAPNGKFDREFSVKYSTAGGLSHKQTGRISGRVGPSTGPGCGSGGSGPLDWAVSEATARIDEPGTPDWHGAKGGSDNIILKLFNDQSYDIYLASFAISWSTPGNQLKHFQHLTEANGWNKQKIWGDGSLDSGNGAAFNDLGNPVANLKIPANQYTIIDDLHFTNNIVSGTQFTLTLNFNDSSSSTLTFTIP